jgi:hypothetical protein
VSWNTAQVNAERCFAVLEQTLIVMLLSVARSNENAVYVTFSQWSPQQELLRYLKESGFKYFRNDDKRQEHVFYKWCFLLPSQLCIF